MSADEARRAVTALRRFHLGDPASRGDVPLGEGFLPALLHPFRDASRVRSEFPVHVPEDPTAEGAACTPIAELLRGALIASAGSEDRARMLADNLVRAERLVRDEVSRSGGRCEVRAALAGAGKRLAAELQLAAGPAQQIQAQWDAMRAAVPEGELLGLDRKTALHLMLSAARAVVPARRRALREEISGLRDRLRALLDVERRKDPEATAPESVKGAVGAAGAAMLDPSALARAIGGTKRGSMRLDARRRARIEETLLVLDEHAESASEPLLTVVHDPGRDPGVVDRDLRLVAMQDPCAAAASLFDVEAERRAIVFRAVRLARLEVEGAYEPDRHDPWLESLDWTRFTLDELLLVPTFVAYETTHELAGARMVSLSKLLTSGRPVHVLAQATPVDADPAGESLPMYRLELGYLGIGHREAYVQQATAARPVHLAEGLRQALGRARAALHVVSTGLDRDGHAPAIGAFLHAGAAIDSRAHPLFRYDPDAGATWARRLDFSGNPDPEEDWASGSLTFRDSGGAEAVMATRFTFADFALLEPVYAGEFRRIDDGVDDPALVPVDEFLSSERGAIAHAVPFVRAVDAAGELHRISVSRRLLSAARDRLDFWRTLQELAGIRNEHVREAVARARDEAAAQARAEIERLEAEHAAELERVRDEAVQGAMDGLARSLLELGPEALLATTSPVAIPRPAAPEAPKPEAAPEAEAPPAAEPEAEEEEVAFEEPWIDTPLCTSCNDCRNINPQLFVYDDNKQARIGDPTAGTYLQLVQAAEKCPARCIHPGLPLNKDEPGLDELVARAAPFNR